MPTGKRVDPYLSFRFRLEIDGLTVAHVCEVTGLQVETEVETYEEGGVNEFVHQLPKRTKYQHLVLKRGITDLEDMWRWFNEVVAGNVKRKSGSIVLMNGDQDTWRWNFTGAYPVKWTGPDFKADSGTVAFETIELAHQGIKKG